MLFVWSNNRPPYTHNISFGTLPPYYQILSDRKDMPIEHFPPTEGILTTVMSPYQTHLPYPYLSYARNQSKLGCISVAQNEQLQRDMVVSNTFLCLQRPLCRRWPVSTRQDKEKYLNVFTVLITCTCSVQAITWSNVAALFSILTFSVPLVLTIVTPGPLVLPNPLNSKN